MDVTIICAGEALIDMLPCGEGAFAPHAGGAVFNTAIALGRLRVPVALVSGVSTDLFGQQLASALAASGVSTASLVRTDRPTTLAFVSFAGGEARYAFYDENTAGRLLRPDDLPPLPESAKALFLGGISLAVTPCADAYEALAHRERDRLIMLDPNIRPSFITDEGAYRARLDRLFALADIVKVSDADLAWLVDEGDIEAQARTMLQRGPKVVFVTLGARGAMAISATQTITLTATPVTVVDSVGAGDTFNAGVLAMLDRAGALTKAAIETADGALLEACLRLGTRAAAITVSRAGANPPWHHELEKPE